jgi:hypothetical protein
LVLEAVVAPVEVLVEEREESYPQMFMFQQEVIQLLLVLEDKA